MSACVKAERIFYWSVVGLSVFRYVRDKYHGKFSAPLLPDIFEGNRRDHRVWTWTIIMHALAKPYLDPPRVCPPPLPPGPVPALTRAAISALRSTRVLCCAPSAVLSRSYCLSLVLEKHCAVCGFCVGRMDHHCVWLNNCVGCGNHRRFVAFVLCQLAYAGLFLAVAVTSFAKELTSQVHQHLFI